MQQRIIWFILFLISISILFFYFVKREQDQTQMYDLQLSDESLTGDVTSTVEVYARLEKKWIGTSKHVQTLQEDLDTQIAGKTREDEKIKYSSKYEISADYEFIFKLLEGMVF